MGGVAKKARSVFRLAHSKDSVHFENKIQGFGGVLKDSRCLMRKPTNGIGWCWKTTVCSEDEAEGPSNGLSVG